MVWEEEMTLYVLNKNKNRRINMKYYYLKKALKKWRLILEILKSNFGAGLDRYEVLLFRRHILMNPLQTRRSYWRRNIRIRYKYNIRELR